MNGCVLLQRRRARPVREHLLFYARIKNFAGKRLRRAVDDALRSVNLFTVGNDLVGGYRCTWGDCSSALRCAAPCHAVLNCAALRPLHSLLTTTPCQRRTRRAPFPGSATTSGPLLLLPCSGGMKRRLSVAISLVGDPLVVYLDEPSTGGAGWGLAHPLGAQAGLRVFAGGSWSV